MDGGGALTACSVRPSFGKMTKHYCVTDERTTRHNHSFSPRFETGLAHLCRRRTTHRHPVDSIESNTRKRLDRESGRHPNRTTGRDSHALSATKHRTTYRTRKETREEAVLTQLLRQRTEQNTNGTEWNGRANERVRYLTTGKAAECCRESRGTLRCAHFNNMIRNEA